MRQCNDDKLLSIEVDSNITSDEDHCHHLIPTQEESWLATKYSIAAEEISNDA